VGLEREPGTRKRVRATGILCVLGAAAIAGAGYVGEAPPPAAPEPPPGAGSPAARDTVPGLHLLDLLPGDPVAARARGPIAAALADHDFARARDLAAALLAERPLDAWARGALCDALLELGDLDAAEREVQRFLDTRPGAPAYFRAAGVLHLRGETDRALELLRLAADAFDSRAREARALALVEMGDLRWFRGDLESARADFDRALALSLFCRRAHVGLGRVAAARGDLEAAIAHLEVGATIPAELGELAFVHAAANQADDARRAVERGLELGARDPTLARSLALCLADHGLRTEEAVRLAEADVRERPSIHAHDALSWALLAAGRAEAALAAATRATALGTREPLLLFHAGMAAAAAGETARAREWLGAALALNPEFHVHFASRARETLARLEAR
jgi:tetratricopeptide (TPR) repeat protein